MYLFHHTFIAKPIEDQISLVSGKKFLDSFFGAKTGVAGLILIALITIYGLNLIASCGRVETTVEEIEQEQEDIDSKFEKVERRALTPIKDDSDGKPEDTEDSYKSFRMGLTCLWLLSNTVLIIGVTSDDFSMAGLGNTSTTRMPMCFRILQYATAVAALIRFFGFLWFLCGTSIRFCLAKR
ncbi:hypothetical protein BU25DRAFT_454699 [Macroventuria anomochaeta]|uniref:Uncharacterized protein n=1 Tax=Macroventuria anomochaeta TaxID=301207 RepID=A0ACB6SGZ5_9PLEO|nr:uncharacterized protein BU25DRAFT_454699 [Macroventuria anomochaeta]KAF2632362.1 hypothetical protein BU25DRAFT_454699 [Macroventuria anomochaeta]